MRFVIIGIRSHWKGSLVTDLPGSAIERNVIQGAKVPEVSAIMRLYPINGASHRAVGAVFATFAQVIVAAWQDPATTRTASAGSAYHQASAPYAEPGGCVNLMADDDGRRVRGTSGRSTCGWPRSSACMTRAACFSPGPEHSALNLMAAIRTEVH